MSDLKFTSVKDTPEMVQAKVSNKLATDVSVAFVKEARMKTARLPAAHFAECSCLQRLYREKGENEKHSYTLSGDLPEMVQAKLNARNLSEVKGVSLSPSLLAQRGSSIRPISYICVWTFLEHIQGILDEDP